MQDDPPAMMIDGIDPPFRVYGDDPMEFDQGSGLRIMGYMTRFRVLADGGAIVCEISGPMAKDRADLIAAALNQYHGTDPVLAAAMFEDQQI